MKSFYFGVLWVVLIMFSSCDKDDETVPDCGCGSETILSVPSEEVAIPEEEQIRGILFFKHPEDFAKFYDEAEFKNRFWILRKSVECSLCGDYLIVCNEDLLGEEFDYLKQKKNVRDSIRIEFTGNIKQICDIKPTPVIYSHGEIVLTSVKIE